MLTLWSLKYLYIMTLLIHYDSISYVLIWFLFMCCHQTMLELAWWEKLWRPPQPPPILPPAVTLQMSAVHLKLKSCKSLSLTTHSDRRCLIYCPWRSVLLPGTLLFYAGYLSIPCVKFFLLSLHMMILQWWNVLFAILVCCCHSDNFMYTSRSIEIKFQWMQKSGVICLFYGPILSGHGVV